MARLFAAVLALVALTGTAQAQGYNVQTTPLGGGWYRHTGTDHNGNSATGTTMPMGGGWSTTKWENSNGRSTTCSTMPLGGGFSTTNCQ